MFELLIQKSMNKSVAVIFPAQHLTQKIIGKILVQ